MECLEVDLLLEALRRKHHLDLRGYATGSLRRRLHRRVEREGLATLSGLQERVLHDPACLGRLLADLAVTVTSMFRDPPFWAAFRATVVPLLRTYPFIRIWVAGCSTGEEAYSLAILLAEEGLYDRARIYATDAHPGVLEHARSGSFPLKEMRGYTENYLQAGGRGEFSSYFTVVGQTAGFAPALARNIVIAQHDLSTDTSFNEFHVVLCRNVLIYFDPDLQDRVHQLFADSLGTFGILALGHKESLRRSTAAGGYTELDAAARIYRRSR